MDEQYKVHTYKRNGLKNRIGVMRFLSAGIAVLSLSNNAGKGNHSIDRR